eukprot:scaffold658068_cov100-Prasinocladus_malaysianus.AAC.1
MLPARAAQGGAAHSRQCQRPGGVPVQGLGMAAGRPHPPHAAPSSRPRPRQRPAVRPCKRSCGGVHPFLAEN